MFIGNSYTYYNSSPELLKALIHEKFPDHLVETQLISGGGMTLADHWQNEGTIQTIRTGDWDYVVLQEQSKLGMGVMVDNDIYFGQTERFFEHARKFDIEITKADAKTVFLMTWSVRDKPKEQAILTHAYTAIAKELKAVLAPVGLVWDELRAKLSDLEIAAHPSQKVPFSYHTHSQIKTIEHAEEIVQQPLQFDLDTLKLEPIIKAIASSKHTRYSPTITVFNNIYQMMMNDDILTSQSLGYMNPMIKMVDSKNQFNRWFNAKQNDSTVVKRIKN